MARARSPSARMGAGTLTSVPSPGVETHNECRMGSRVPPSTEGSLGLRLSCSDSDGNDVRADEKRQRIVFGSLGIRRYPG